MEITRNPVGQWLVYASAEPTIFETESQARWFALSGESTDATIAARSIEVMAQKLELARAIVAQAQLLAVPMDASPDAVQEYFDSGITFVDEDVAALGITAAQVVACITMLENVNKFFSGGNPTNAQYRVNINAVRRAK